MVLFMARRTSFGNMVLSLGNANESMIDNGRVIVISYLVTVFGFLQCISSERNERSYNCPYRMSTIGSATVVAGVDISSPLL